MKARLLSYEGVFQLLLCNGRIKTLSAKEACDFLMNFDNQKYYAAPGPWNHEGVTIESFRGTTIAVIEDDGTLRVEHPAHFRTILHGEGSKLLTVSEYAAKHSKQVSIIRRLCRTQRLPGAINKGNAWFIPEDTPYPADERMRNKP